MENLPPFFVFYVLKRRRALKKIHAFLIDLKHVVKTWNRYNHNTDIQYLIEEIIKHNEEAKAINQ